MAFFARSKLLGFDVTCVSVITPKRNLAELFAPKAVSETAADTEDTIKFLRFNFPPWQQAQPSLPVLHANANESRPKNYNWLPTLRSKAESQAIYLCARK